MAGGRELAYHNLATMLEAGVPARKALATVVAGLRGGLAGDFRYLGEAMGGGMSPSQAMASRPARFPPFDVLMVQAGETSGLLGQAFHDLSQSYAFRRRLRQTIVSGLAYPVMLYHAAAFLLPLSAMFLGGLSVGGYLLAVVRFLAALYVPAGIVVAVIYLAPRGGGLRKVLDSIALQVPLLGGALLRLGLGRFCAVFGSLLRAGVPITQALPLAAQACGNTAVARLLEGSVQSVRQGSRAWQGFSGRLPRDFIAAWASGEESGNLDDVTARLAAGQAEDAKWRLGELAKWIPRIIYFLIVLRLAAAILAGLGGVVLL